MSIERELSRRSFMRRVLGGAVGLLSLEFVGGSLAFLWPNVRNGLGAAIPVGAVADLLIRQPSFADGYPMNVGVAQSFLVNVPAAKALATGAPTPEPAPGAGDFIALWRRCPHLACMVPELCDERKRFQCLCHGSTYNILGEKLEKGPASRGMDRFAVTVDADGIVVIDTREVITGAPAGATTFRDAFPPEVGCVG